MKILFYALPLLFCFIFNPLFSQEKINSSISNTETDTLKVKSSPVILQRDTLFFINSSSPLISIKQRADKISKRLTILTKNYKKGTDTIYLRKGNDFVNIMYNNDVAFITTKEDALNYNTSITELSRNQISIIKKVLDEKISHLTLKEWLIRLGYFILSFAGLILVLKLLRWIFKFATDRLSKFDKIFLSKNKNILKYLIPKDTKNIFVFIANATRLFVTVVFLLGYLPFMFSFFPWTEGIVALFYDYISTPIKFLFFGFIAFIPSLIFILVIIYFTRYIIRVEQSVIEDIENEKLKFKGFHKDWANPTEKIIRIIIYAFALVLIFPHIPGSNSSAFKGVSIFIGAIISFGSTSAITNIIAGIVITYMRPFKIGDRVKIGQITGDVIEKTSLMTRVRTVKNVEVTIPNANILSGTIINYSAESKQIGLILHTSITLGYDVPWDLAQKLLLRAARKSMMIQREPKPFVLQTSLDDNYVSYELNAYTKQEKKMPLIYSDLHRNILEVFNEAGVEILSPSYVSARDGNPTTVPSLIKPNDKSPIEKIVDHLTGKNQKITINKTDENSKE